MSQALEAVEPPKATVKRLPRRTKIFVALAILAGIVVLAALLADVEYAYMPGAAQIMVSPRHSSPAYDLWGEGISPKSEAAVPDGAVRIDDVLLKLGRETFYRETFGNEVFMSDILGLNDGPLGRWQYFKALAALRGEGTSNLRVALGADVTIGDKTWKKGDEIDTGLDVPKGSIFPLGLSFRYSHGRLREGFTCALCHATVDPQTKLIVEGAPNSDLNGGLLLAFGTNSAAYFTHGQFSPHELPTGEPRDLSAADALPNAADFEAQVDRALASWPPGNFDSTIDLVSNPAQIPDSFTAGDHPYGWSGFGMAGPFKGLTALCNNVHAQNSDSLTQIALSSTLFDIDSEAYIALILRGSANASFRYDPESDQVPSEFLASVDPTPDLPGINEIALPPDYPKVSLAVPDGVVVGSPGHKFCEQNNALAAWQNTLWPPKPQTTTDAAMLARGRDVFERAKCADCHSGEYLTNNRIVAANVLRVEPTRARSFAKTQPLFVLEPKVFAYDVPVPVPAGSKELTVPVDHLPPVDIELAWAQNGSEGGYKTPSLVGLLWTAPYLHDGGVAAGAEGELGIVDTLLNNKPMDPAQSLRALVDRKVRQRMVAANAASQALAAMNVTGAGHEFWIDAEAGFSQSEQDAAVAYLLYGAGVNPPGQPAAVDRVANVKSE